MKQIDMGCEEFYKTTIMFVSFEPSGLPNSNKLVFLNTSSNSCSVWVKNLNLLVNFKEALKYSCESYLTC